MKITNEPGHITVLPTILASGEYLRNMIIIQTQSINNELDRYGLPNSPQTLIVGSELKIRRICLNKLQATALLILDGATAHSCTELIAAISHNLVIDCYFLSLKRSHLKLLDFSWICLLDIQLLLLTKRR